jgi:hypothetical protein
MPNIEFEYSATNSKSLINSLLEIYPEMEQQIRSEQNLRKMFTKFFLKLIFDKKLNEFKKITDSLKIIKSCRILIENESNDCLEGDFGIKEMDEEFELTQLAFTNQLNIFETKDKTRIEKIIIKLHSTDSIISGILLFNRCSKCAEYEVHPLNYHKTKITFTTFSIRKLNSIEISCVTDENEKDFGEEYFNYCEHNCFFKRSNQSLSCVPIDQIDIYFNRYLFHNDYQLCDDSYDENYFSAIVNDCRKLCKSKCNLLSFDTKIESTENISNETVLEVIPKKSPHIGYIETLKTDFDRLIYNCGGILGLWFGITPVKAYNLSLYSILFCKNLIVKGVRFVYYIIVVRK